MKKIIKYLNFIILFIFATGSASGYYNDGMMGYGQGEGMMGYGFGYIYFLIFLLFIIGLVTLLFKYLNNNTFYKHHKEDYIEILKKRLASGNIKENEFDKLKKKLEKK